ncbi:uncharacterized protein CIMG_12808 [Coccidioides immitis RS]|uniref:Uncharacterized protein n=1 Tax=Coccidioides immitis (strain RS) TaxID=246410 RepID=A0A0D8JVC7_COCIM|nr:uncharacterized protein CIMG_12808 [Coccidioides immitis RS]KJF60223.1 hypothetical protein CIMG_12808 [Coccidioides immitis RS]
MRMEVAMFGINGTSLHRIVAVCPCFVLAGLHGKIWKSPSQGKAYQKKQVLKGCCPKFNIRHSLLDENMCNDQTPRGSSQPTPMGVPFRQAKARWGTLATYPAKGIVELLPLKTLPCGPTGAPRASQGQKHPQGQRPQRKPSHW